MPTPNVIDLSYEDAKLSLVGSNLKLKVIGDTTLTNAVVLRQKPAPNENITVGYVVTIWIGDTKSGIPQNDNRVKNKNDDN